MEPSASRSRRSSAASSGFAALLACACVEPRTEIVVVVDSDMAVGADLDALGLQVSGPDGDLARDQILELGVDDSNRHALPVTFGIAPRGGDPERAVRVDLTAYDEDETYEEGRRALFATHRITTFREGVKLRLDIVLAQTCIELAESCEPEVCAPDGCISEVVDPSSLSVWEPDDL